MPVSIITKWISEQMGLQFEQTNLIWSRVIKNKTDSPCCENKAIDN